MATSRLLQYTLLGESVRFLMRTRLWSFLFLSSSLSCWKVTAKPAYPTRKPPLRSTSFLNQQTGMNQMLLPIFIRHHKWRWVQMHSWGTEQGIVAFQFPHRNEELMPLLKSSGKKKNLFKNQHSPNQQWDSCGFWRFKKYINQHSKSHSRIKPHQHPLFILHPPLVHCNLLKKKGPPKIP